MGSNLIGNIYRKTTGYMVACALAVSGICGCSEDAGSEADSLDTSVTQPDSAADTAIADVPTLAVDGGADMAMDGELAIDTIDDAGDTTTAPPVLAPRGCPGRPGVAVDLTPWLPTSGGTVRVAAITQQNQTIPGEVPEGRIGDYVLENSHARFLVGVGNEAISPCSYDGNLVDMVRTDLPEAVAQGDILGEICFLLNGGLTFAPECAEVLSTGDNGLAALAITGRLEILDFLNLKQMVGDYAPFVDLEQIAFDFDHIPPLTLTITYLLRPDDTGVTVLTALRNDGSVPESFIASHLVMSGSTGEFFNPLGGTGGFGTTSLSLENLAKGSHVPFIGYLSDRASYMYVPKPYPTFVKAGLPFGGSQLAVSGVAVNTFDIDTFLLLLATKENVRNGTAPGFRRLLPGETTVYEHAVFAGDGRLQSVLAPAYQRIGVPTQVLRGRVTGPESGAPAEGVVLSAVSATADPPMTYNQTQTREDGTFEMNLPEGDYVLKARTPGSYAEVSVQVTAGLGPIIAPPLVLPPSAHLRVSIRDAAGLPAIGRVTITCPDGCPNPPDHTELDLSNQPPGNWARIVPVGPQGETVVELPPGRYRVLVSRGMTHSVWPPGGLTKGDIAFWGQSVALVGGETVTLNAEIHRVIDLSGVLSGDFHIHAMASSDSEVSNIKRVMDFLTEGVDVMVSTDHDAITDFAPTIQQLGLQNHIASLIGAEITTPNIGHFNAFPLVRDPIARKGGPIDWSNGAMPNLTPEQLYQSVADHSGAVVGEQVVQINHATGSGTIGALKANVLTGQSFADREALRMPPAEGFPDPETGDTGLWSDDFTAMEVLNGHSMNNFWGIMRWWLTLASRGAPRTGTAVSDTHGLYGDLGGSPRSWVFVGQGQDTAATLDSAGFVDAVNSGRLIGTNGPFFRVTVHNELGQQGGLGHTVSLVDGKAWAELDIQTPDWMRTDTIDVYLNETADLLDNPDEPGQARTDPLAPSFQVPIGWQESDSQVVAAGAVEHRVWRRKVQIPLEIPPATGTDGWVVFLVRGLGENIPSMTPILRNGGVKPLAFSNPIYLDADGNGYDHPPLSALAKSGARLERADRKAKPKADEIKKRAMTREDLAAILQGATGCHNAEETPALTKPRSHSHSHPH